MMVQRIIFNLLQENSELYSKLISYDKNHGKASIKKRFKEATGDIFLIQDADLEYLPNIIFLF